MGRVKILSQMVLQLERIFSAGLGHAFMAQTLTFCLISYKQTHQVGENMTVL